MKNNTALVIGQLGLVHSLGEAGIPFILGIEKDKNCTRYSRFVKNVTHFSSFKSEKFIDELCELSDSLPDKPVIFSDDDDAIYSISEHRERLQDRFLFSFPNKETVSKVLDKQHFSIFAEKNGLPTPKSFNISSINELNSALDACELPCIIKPVFRSDWYHPDFSSVVGKYKKAFVLDNREDLLQLYKKISTINPRMVLQEYIEGDDKLHFSVNMYVDDDHITRGIYIAQKFRVYPIHAGMGSFIKTVKDDEVERVSSEIVKKLKLKGLLNIQFKRDSRNNKPYLIEMHFRNSVWGNLGPAAGVNLYNYYYKGLIGEELPVSEPAQIDVKYINLERDILGFFEYRAAGELTFREWVRSYSGKVTYGDLKLSDPLPFVAKFGRKCMSRFR
jgi:predicted ATP-grasp superfamily ATP-dependent carboligase